MRKQRVAIFNVFVEQTNEKEREKFVSYIFENWGIEEGAPFETGEEEEITKEEECLLCQHWQRQSLS